MLNQKDRRHVALALLAGALLTVGLGADLAFRGLAWRVFYNLTGEETPLGQLNGMLQWSSNLTRLLPVAAAPEVLATGPVQNPIGVNTFLEDEVEPAKRDRQLALIEAAGIGWIRQQFRWDDLEISGRGDFTDSRNGAAISAWDKYDNIVDLAATHNVQIIARLGSPPAWSQAQSNQMPGYAPPADLADFARYARTVADRYKGRITHYQVWNEPNLYPEWGIGPPNPEDFTKLLCSAYTALKAADPSNSVILGALGPTGEINDRNLTDYIFLQRLYDAGGGACFDVLSVQGYGLRSGPTDQRIRAMNININHPLYLREIMQNNGDARKPIWVSEMAWNPVPDDPAIANRDQYGVVTDTQAAQYTVEAYQRIARDWLFVQVVSYWFFKRAGDSERDQSWYYFRMVDPDFTLRPVYSAVQAYARQLDGTVAAPATVTPP